MKTPRSLNPRAWTLGLVGWIALAPAHAADTQVVSLTASGQPLSGNWLAAGDLGASISGDGTRIAFASTVNGIVPNDTNNLSDVFVRDLTLGTTTLVSRTPTGLPGNASSTSPRISTDGRYVVFLSDSSNLISGDLNFTGDVFVCDLTTLMIERASLSSAQQELELPPLGEAAISGDGTHVAFAVWDAMAPGDVNGTPDVYVRDLVHDTTIRASVTASGQSFFDIYASPFALSQDGLRVAFATKAAFTPSDTNGKSDIYVKDLSSGSLTLASLGSGGVLGNGDSTHPSLNSAGTLLAFQSTASNLVAGDTNGTSDVFVRDLNAATTSRMSVATLGPASGSATRPRIAADGRFVVFESTAPLWPGDDNSVSDVYARDRVTAQTIRISTGLHGELGSAASNVGSVSADGRYFVFTSNATNLIANDSNNGPDVLRRDRVGFTELLGASALPSPPILAAVGSFSSGGSLSLTLSQAPANRPALLLSSIANDPVSAFQGVLHAFPTVFVLTVVTDGGGSIAFGSAIPAAPPALPPEWVIQYLIAEPSVPSGAILSNALLLGGD